jgi:hypothetical protein
MSRRTEMPYKVDGTDQLAQHSNIRCSVPEINGAVAQGKFTFLLREIWAGGTAATPTSSREQTPGTAVREDRRASPEVSRSHSTGRYEPGNTPEGLTTREGPNLADNTTLAGRRLAMKPTGGAQAASQRGRESVLTRPQGLPGTAGRGPACPVVWGAGGQSSRLPDFGHVMKDV